MIKCAWDVGIKNLAFNIKSNNQILHWDIINLVSDEIIKCDGVFKNNKTCSVNAKFCAVNTNNTSFAYCGTHKSQYVSKRFNNMTEKEYIESITTSTPDNTCIKCKKKSVLNNMCRIHYNANIKSIIKSCSLKSVKQKKCTEYDPHTFAKKMFSKLDERPELLQVDLVKIENQPCLKNPIMKSIGVMLFSYYVLKNMQHNLNIEIKYVSAASKLKVHDIDDFIRYIGNDNIIFKILENILIKQILGNDKYKIKERDNKFYEPYTKEKFDNMKLELIKHLVDKNNKITDDVLLTHIKNIKKDDKMYNINKEISVQYTKYELRDTEWIDFLKKYKKIDDLCDAYRLNDD